MFGMKKALFGLAILITLLGFQSTPAQAVVLEFQEGTTSLLSFDASLVLQGSHFKFENVTTTFNTTGGGTGLMSVVGTIKDVGPGEIWNMTMTMNQVSLATGALSLPVPYDGMFNDMIGNPGAVLTHDQISFQITPTVASPGYTGFTSGVGTFFSAMFPSSPIHATEIGYRHFGNNVNNANTPFDYYGVGGWLQNQQGTHSGDFYFTIFNPTIIPEPATVATFLIGLGGLAVRRFRQKLAA